MQGGSLEEVRSRIDEIDPKIRDLILARLDCSFEVAKDKQRSNSRVIYRAEREEEILARLSEGVPEEKRAEYLSVLRKIMETSRMYQYGLLYDWNEGIFEELLGDKMLPEKGSRVLLRISRVNRVNAMSSILSMIGDYGYNMQTMDLLESDEKKGTVTFHLCILGDLNETGMKKLMFQLSMECLTFEILKVS